MIAVLITLGVLVGILMAVIIPRALLRHLEHNGEAKKDKGKEEE